MGVSRGALRQWQEADPEVLPLLFSDAAKDRT